MAGAQTISTDRTDGALPPLPVLQSSDEAMAVLGPMGEIQTANAAFDRLLGRDATRASPEDFIRVLSAPDLSRLRVGLAYLDDADAEERSPALSFALRLTGPEGSGPMVWLEARALPSDGHAPRWLTRFHREHPALLRALADHGGDGAALIGPDGRIQALTSASARFLDADPLVLIDERFTNLARAEDSGGVSDALAQALAAEAPVGTEKSVVFTLPWGDGRRACVAVDFLPLAQDGEHGQGAIAIFRDMTDLQDLERERDTALRTAEDASQTKSRFLAGMSHELRTPLNAIIGFSDILHQELFGPLGNERYKEYVGLIRESGAALLQLITDILDLARIDAGRYALRPERIDAAALVSQEVETWRDRAALKQVTLELALPPEKPKLFGDRLAMSQILTNLLSNAVKFTEPEGRVTVAIEEHQDGICLIVMDTGIGIPADMLPKLGRPFEQVVAETSEHGSGNGIGLALVHALVGLHQGSVTIDSTVGDGTIVSVRLPHGEPESADRQDRDTAPALSDSRAA